MKFWLILITIIAIIIGYPYIRCFFKRLRLRRRIVRTCEEKGCRLHPTHRLWWLGHKRGSSCDFYIETPSRILSIKLFGLRRHRDVLIFTSDRKWFIRRFLAFVSNIGTSLRLPVESKTLALSDYDFRRDFHLDWEIKTPNNILLIHPTCHEIRRRVSNGTEVIIGAGDTVDGMAIYSLSRFLGLLGGDL